MSIVNVIVGAVDGVEQIPTERILAASDVKYTPSGQLTATNVQDAIDQSSVFGSYYNYAEIWAEYPVATGTTKTPISISAALPTGKYLVTFSYMFYATGVFTGSTVNVNFDGVVLHTFNTPTGSYQTIAGHRQVTVSTAKTLSVTISVTQSGALAAGYIKQASISFIKVSN